MKIKFLDRVGDALKAFSGVSTALPFSMAGFNSGLRRKSSESDPMGNYAGFVYAALSKRAKRVGAIELHLYEMNRAQDVEEVFDHDLLSLLGRANPMQSRYQFFYTIEMMLGIWGSAPIYKDRMGGRTVMNLWPLRPDYLKAVTNTDGVITGYEYRIGTKVEKFTTEDIILINEPNPASIAKGFSPVGAASLEIDADVQAALWNKHLIENFAEPGGVLTTEQSIDDKSFDRIQKQWNQRHQGAANAGRWALLEKGLKADTIGRSPQEMDLIESRKFNRNAITSILGVPMALLTSEDVNLANAEAAERIFAKDTIEPQMKLVVGMLNEFLVPEYGDNLELDNDSPVPEDTKQKVELATAGEGKWMTVNEARDMFDLAPLDGGDAIFKPLGVYPQVGTDAKAAKIPASGYEKILSGKGGFTRETKRKNRIKSSILARTRMKRKLIEGITQKTAKAINDHIKSASGMKVTGINIVSKDHSHDGECKAHGGIKIRVKADGDEGDDETRFDPRLLAERKEFIKKLPRAQKQAAARMQGYFSQQQKEVLANLASEGLPKGRNGGVPAVKSIDRWVNKIIFDQKKNNDLLVEMAGEMHRDNIEIGARAVASLLGVDPSMVLATPFVVDFINDRGFLMLSVNKTTTDALRETLTEGVALGEDLGEIRERISTVYDEAQDFRAETIARTEVGAAQNFGRTAEMKNQKVEKKVWIAIYSNTREGHKATAGADGQIVNTDETFLIDGEELDYPGDPAGSPGNTINCQCSVSPTLGE